MPPRFTFTTFTTVVATVVATVATVAVSLLPALGAHGAPADPPKMSVQAQIDAHLAAHPGGRQINATEIAYHDGGFVITFARPEVGVAGLPDCPGGKFCFYDQVAFGYPRGKLADCGWQDLGQYGWHDRTESVHYNLSYGSVTFINHGGQSDHSGDGALFNVGVGNRTDDNVYPFRNLADHVYRFC